MTGDNRGQTSIDFLVGMSVFLLTVALVFGMLPNTFAPFTGGDNANLLTADRVAAHLTEGTLARPNQPNVLNETCTEQFFGSSGACHPTDRLAALGVRPSHQVNVTIESDDGIRTLNGTELQSGPSVPTSGSVVVTSRRVSLDGDECTLFVRLW